MRKITVLLLVFVLTGFVSQAQVSKPGVPPSFSWPEERQQLGFETMAPVNAAALLAEDMIFDTIKDIPWRFGQPIMVDMDLKNAGSWYVAENGDRVWRLGIKSPGAYALSLTFDRFILPPGAELYVYKTDRSQVEGAFTDLNNQEDMYFATTLFMSDEIIIEYYEPNGVAFPGELKIESVNHAYRDPLTYVKAFGGSGSCNLNVACPESEGWEDQIRSVGMILRNGSAWCTGALINNTAHDGRPFFLTANHCYATPGSLVVWFNWQSETCTNPSTPPPYDAVGGLVDRARNAASDFWLLEFNNPIPEHVGPFFSGWNRALPNTIAETIIGIHHPSGDIKKFSYAEGGVTNSSYLGAPGSGTTHWRITWSGGTTTEGGSSGSPIYDAQHRIIGQLHGGYAECGNTAADYYGRLGVSWTGGGSTATRLSDWLDPLGTGAEAIDGYDPFGELVEDVTNLEANPLSPYAVELTYELNENQNPVLIAYNTEEAFGIPNGEYYLGQEIAGGGQVIYIGDAEVFLHEPLEVATTYYYTIWSRSETGKYSEGAQAQATTLCPVISELPLLEGFDAQEMPLCWAQEQVEGTLSWQIGAGNGTGNPEEAYEGDYNAYFKATTESQHGMSTRLITPVIDFGDYEMGELSFYLANAENEELQDVLHVYYRASAEEDWLLLATFDVDEPEWTLVTIELPTLGSAAQFAFEATAEGGHGVAIDQVSIAGYYDAAFPAPTDLTAAVNTEGVVTLGWTAPEVTPEHPDLNGYRVYRNGQLLAAVAGAGTLAFSDTGLEAGTYTYAVTATYQNPTGESLPSNEAEIEIEPAAIQYELTIQVSGNGTTNPVAGTYTYNEGTQVNVSANPAPGSYFVNWLEDGEVLSAEQVVVVTMNDDRSIMAVFALNEYEVELLSSPENVGVQTGAGTYQHGQTASIATSLPHGYTFIHWKENGNIFSTSPSFQAVVTQDRQFVAYYSVNQYEVTVAPDPDGGGQVSGGGVFDFGTEITVTAEVEEGYDFGGWRENGQLVSNELSYTFVVENDRDLVARFNIKTYLVSLQITPQGSGVVSGGGTFNHGATANVAAAIYAGYQFVAWEENGEVVSTNNPYSFTVTSSRSLVAVLESTAKTLVLAVDGLGTTYPPPGTYTYQLNANVSVAAVANPGWHFVRWEVDGETVTESNLQLTITDNISATAFFMESVSTNDLTEENGLRIYPQPASGQLHIEWSNLAGHAVIEMFNLSGQRMMLVEEHASNQGMLHTTLDVSQLQSGLYLMRITSNGNAIMQKVMIQ